ncbi:hypothetical protein CEXT_717791 [Caerostris extrusa]|uniref:Ribosomal protein L4 n=1 Tax=Caerostris extrusa TaxID=172846 RepID=A0AAV4T2L1_CAEEX|nr:hypothetical protein CEXT_717791 [Caerostris extrusa]
MVSETLRKVVVLVANEMKGRNADRLEIANRARFSQNGRAGCDRGAPYKGKRGHLVKAFRKGKQGLKGNLSPSRLFPRNLIWGLDPGMVSETFRKCRSLGKRNADRLEIANRAQLCQNGVGVLEISRLY